MGKLILLYWGCIVLMYLSQRFYPEGDLQNKRRNGNFILDRSDIFMCIVIGWLTAFMFLRREYNDTVTYRIHFMESESVSEYFARSGYLELTGNPLSELYRDVMRELTDHFQIYFFFPSVLSCIAVVKLCKRYSVSPAFSLLIFFSVGTYLMYMAALKQCIAVFILLSALPYAIEKKYARFYAMVFLAVLFHTHAFLFAIVPILMGNPWGKGTWIFLGVTLFAMATYNVTLGAFMRYAQSIGALVDESELFDGHSINVLRVLVYWIPVLFALFFRRRLFMDSTRTENLFVNMSITSAFILTIGLVQAANLFARMAGYFEIAIAIALPWMINKVFTKRSVSFVTGCAAVLYFAYFWYENAINRGFEYDYVSNTLWEFILSLFA